MRGEGVSANYSFIAPSSEELCVRKPASQSNCTGVVKVINAKNFKHS